MLSSSFFLRYRGSVPTLFWLYVRKCSLDYLDWHVKSSLLSRRRMWVRYERGVRPLRKLETLNSFLPVIQPSGGRESSYVPISCENSD